MVLEKPGAALVLTDRARPEPGPDDVLIAVEACGLCRTDIHLQDGDIEGCAYPIVPGHQIVGRVVEAPSGSGLLPRDRVGVPWLGWTCGGCAFCERDEENLCGEARFTGCHRDGGFAEYAAADQRYCFPLGDHLDAVHAAPLLCAGLIGYRSLRLAGDVERLGIYGFGAAGSLLAPVAVHLGIEVHGFTRPGDRRGQRFALERGCVWAGGSDERPPAELDAAIIFAPIGALVPAALKGVRRGGRVVCGGIHMSDIPTFPYADLWGERQIRSVANLTRRDGREFLALAAEAGLEPEVTVYPLADANRAFDGLRQGAFDGAAVIVP